jgi:predicted transposase YbfD/YdcC
MLNAYRSDWPKLAQVIRVERERRIGDATHVEVAYDITSLDQTQADAARLLELIRAHWGVENRLHSVRDTTFGEDASRVRSGAAPQVLAAFRNAVIHLLEGVEATSKAAARRRLAARPDEAILLIST